jgi:26S proteasome regulatory subunit N1
VQKLVPYHMAHNSEPEAVDLLLEVDDIGSLLEHVDSDNYARTCLYLTSTAAYLPERDDRLVFAAAFDAYMKVEKWHDAMRVALRVNDGERVRMVFATCGDGLDKQQLAYLLARQGVTLDVEEGPCAIEDEELRGKACARCCNRLQRLHAASQISLC